MQRLIGTRSKRVLAIAGVILLLLAGWVAYDLFAPRTANLKQFDPNEVARLETAMWRSYYGKERVKLFRELAELLRTQYNMPFVRSNLVAFYAAKAAFVFQKGSKRADYEQAVPDLIKFYAAIRNMSDLPFDVERAAMLELEWWIIHRERAKHAPGDLARSLAELQAEIYRLPLEKFAEHAKLRADAMAIRDTKAAAGGVTEEDWTRIDQMLHESWRSLHRAVQ